MSCRIARLVVSSTVTRDNASTLRPTYMAQNIGAIAATGDAEHRPAGVDERDAAAAGAWCRWRRGNIGADPGDLDARDAGYNHAQAGRHPRRRNIQRQQAVTVQ